MCELADLEVSRSAAIDFSDDGLGGGIAKVVKPGFDGDFGSGFGEITEAEEVGVGGGIDPDGGFEFGRDAGCLRRIEAGAGHLENAGELDIVANDLGEEGSV
jgi:hypothetical protein